MVELMETTNMVPTLIIYHAGCWDGLCAAWIAAEAEANAGRSFLLLPAHYGDTPPPVRGRVIVLDFCYPRDVMERIALESKGDMVVLDHHETALAALVGFEEWAAKTDGVDWQPRVVFDMNKSGAVLAWDFFKDQIHPDPLVQYIQDRDLWKWELPGSREVNAFLRSYPMEFSTLSAFRDAFRPNSQSLARAIDVGSAILRMQKQVVDTHVKNAVEMEIGGYKVLAVNATTLTSEIGEALAQGRPFGATFFRRKVSEVLGISWDCRETVFSLRSTKDGINVAEVAKTFGGGGHKHAAGFTLP